MQSQPDNEDNEDHSNRSTKASNEAICKKRYLLRYNTWATGYDFKLTLLLVSDELDEGIPVAQCISNRETIHFMEIFLKEKGGL